MTLGPHDLMVESAREALRTMLSVRRGDSVLIICDGTKLVIADAFLAAAKGLGGVPELLDISDLERPLTDVPKSIQSAIQGRKVILNLFEAVASESPFRVKLLKLQRAAGARIGHAPSITEDMMTEGPMTVDFEMLARHADGLIAALADVTEIRIGTHAGTDLQFSIRGRRFVSDLRIRPGTFGNLPAGEIFCSIVEDSARGTIVADSSATGIGALPDPIRIEVLDGRIAGVSSRNTELAERVKKQLAVDDQSQCIGEIGIGINPRGRLMGIPLEDEKAGGTANISFGNNIDLPGGRNDSASRTVFTVCLPTLSCMFKDGSTHEFIRDGQMLVWTRNSSSLA